MKKFLLALSVLLVSMSTLQAQQSSGPPGYPHGNLISATVVSPGITQYVYEGYSWGIGVGLVEATWDCATDSLDKSNAMEAWFATLGGGTDDWEIIIPPTHTGTVNGFEIVESKWRYTVTIITWGGGPPG